MLHRHLDKYLVLDALAVDNRFIELLIAPVQVGDKFLDTALVMESLLMLYLAVITQRDPEVFRQECRLTQAYF